MKKFIIIAICILAVLIVGMFFIHENRPDTEITKETTKVALILNGQIDDKGWGQSHYEGLCASAQKLNLEICYRENIPFDDTCLSVIEELIEQGCEIVICNSYNYGEWIDQIAKDYPEVAFFHATGTGEGDNLATYFGRIYQMRYLSGVVAGLQTETDSIGYVAAFPISEVNRGINAFTLGVQSVNPSATVHVIWSDSWTDDEMNRNAAETLIKECNADVLAMHCDSIVPLDVAEENGIWSVGYNMDNSELYPDSYLTAAVWNWEAFYTPQITKYLQGKIYSGNYWQGVESGLIGLAPLTDNVKQGTAEIVEEKAAALNVGTYDVFYGPVYDMDGNIRIGAGENMPDEALLNQFDWYVKGVNLYE